MLRTVDTDVLVLAVCTAQELKDRQSQPFEIWVSFGTGKNHRNIPAHMIASNLSPQAARSLPAFHAFTGCDTVSSFLGKGKKSALSTWINFPDVTEAFLALTNNPSEANPHLMNRLQRFVVLLYDRTSTKATVNEARKQLFIQKGRQFDNIPPTEAALAEHVKRTAYQAGYIWGQTLTPSPELPKALKTGDGLWKMGSGGHSGRLNWRS